MKFQIPFELMVVFSTNLEPADLADEAFLRRIHNKIYVEAVDPASFDQIFARVIQARGLQAESDTAEYVRQAVLARGPQRARACYPGDICNILHSIGRYEGRPPRMTKPELNGPPPCTSPRAKAHGRLARNRLRRFSFPAH